MKKTCVIGHFGFGEQMLNGQTIKTKTVTVELEKQLGADQVTKIDTHKGIRGLPCLVLQMLRGFCCCENILILPAQNGIRLFVPLCSLLNKLFHRKLHYVVIGGWLNSYLDAHSTLEKPLKRFHGIYVETSTMKRALEERGMHNVVLMPNFKDIQILAENELVYPIAEPYRLCTFSRVMQEKGISDAVDAVKSINEKFGRTVFALDIYGQVDSEQVQWFDELKASFSPYIRYQGLVSFDQSVEVLKNYFALLFPTRFYTEGIPGTILDAYAAGVPVISAKWESFADIVDEGVTGIGYPFEDQTSLKDMLLQLAEKPDAFLQMKRSCIAKAENFKPEAALAPLLRRL